ncbi:hypothetical protein HN51_006354 [Arachis hypogaea]|uniref:coumaroyl-CoA:anthocyanidin 3-O-glucoside-6''-O-coumaroyltransferase 1 n=1 Tax=Arachis hypogaea TaxID=3818 RepID=UPI000DED27F0|nr:coumaroyl-CoA:anthocyanidin 3-O-glucoside-6''-O-coumaroyltransferase 1 [Arachis hypogaea]QHO10141.1 Coumaroyl-CoA:anthocyanidin 3-O-glucoside-6''-O-coumaroyltransferase [Arachis hypogaea]
MANKKVKVIEQCQIGPPPGSVSSTSIPLTFFDIPWLCCPPIKRVFFYEFHYPKSHLLQEVIPNLKQSLPLTLKHFFPFSSNIVFRPKPQTPHILYKEGDTLPFIVAESTTTNLNNLVSDSPRDVTCLHPFVPVLPSPRALEEDESGTLLISPMAIQVTIFPNSGLAICITFRHVVADGRAFHHFMKFWASICGPKVGLDLPLLDRNMIQDPNGLRPIFLEAIWNIPIKTVESTGQVNNVPSDMVRRTFVVRNEHVENLKKYVTTKCQNHGLETLHVSTFVVTCSLIWVCKVKSENNTKDDDELHILAIMADSRNLPQFSIPLTYFGNCVVCGNAKITKSKLVGQNGIFEAAIAIGSKIRCLQYEGYKGAETLMSNFTEFATLGKHMLLTAGSPKLDVYETDFGWGKPKMSEVVQVESSMSVSLSDCKGKGGIEVGIALGRTQMMKFNTLMEEFLEEIAVHDS